MAHIDLSDVYVEPIIKPLVDILNEIPFIATISSCQGHYESDNYEEYQANVLFEIDKGTEPLLMDLATRLLSTTAPMCYRYEARIKKTFYIVPDGENELEWTYSVVMKPFDVYDSTEDKRTVTDQAIADVVRVVEQYIEDMS